MTLHDWIAERPEPEAPDEPVAYPHTCQGDPWRYCRACDAERREAEES